MRYREQIGDDCVQVEGSAEFVASTVQWFRKLRQEYYRAKAQRERNERVETLTLELRQLEPWRLVRGMR